MAPESDRSPPVSLSVLEASHFGRSHPDRPAGRPLHAVVWLWAIDTIFEDDRIMRSWWGAIRTRDGRTKSVKSVVFDSIRPCARILTCTYAEYHHYHRRHYVFVVHRPTTVWAQVPSNNRSQQTLNTKLKWWVLSCKNVVKLAKNCKYTKCYDTETSTVHLRVLIVFACVLLLNLCRGWYITW